MARYCFYCGKQLNEGEKCRCREHFYQAAADSKTEPSSAKEEGKEQAKEKSSDPKSSSETKDSSSAEKKRKAKDCGKDYNPFKRPFTYHRGKRFREKFFGGRQKSSLRGFYAWIKRPADKIKEQAISPAQNKVSLLAILINIFFLSIWFILFFYNIPLKLQSLNIAAARVKIEKLILYSLFMAVFFLLMEAFIIWFLTKLTERLKISYLDILKAGRSTYIYLPLFVLLAISSMPSSMLAGIALLGAGFFFAAYVHIRSLCHLYRIDGNSQIRLMVFTIICLAALFFFTDLLLPLLFKIELQDIPADMLS